ncbi:MAG: S26 family signal peptidase [Actinomycetota bacterium]|nr:S26 family signal peptidase [Actinomycetota bacterium]
MRRALLWSAMLTLAFAVARTMRKWFPVRVVGESMAPSILPGDLLAVRPCRRGEPARGDVVVVRLGEMEVVKRSVSAPLDVELLDDHLWLEGDAAARSTDSRHTGPVHRDAVQGIVVARYWPPSRARLFIR